MIKAHPDGPEEVHDESWRLNQDKELRERSGTVLSDDKLVSFFYDLIRDHLPIGTVESLVREAQYGEVRFTNGHLANYCKDLAERLK